GRRTRTRIRPLWPGLRCTRSDPTAKTPDWAGPTRTPVRPEIHAPRLLRVAWATINGVVYGVLGTSLAQALLIVVGLWAAGIPAALLLGLVLFVLALVPFGPALIWAPAAAWLYFDGAIGWAIFVVVW